MKALLLIMLGGVLVNNYALEKFLGVGPVLGGRKYGSAAMGFSVAAVMLLAAAVTWPLYRLLVLLGAGLGFVLAMVLFDGVKSKINERYVPKAFRGLPVMLLAASIISLAFYAFK